MNAVRKNEWLCPRNVVAGLAAGAMLAVAGAASAGVIKIGASLRMKTETGEKYGQMVVDELSAINAAGGVNGHTIEVKLLNDECKSDIGVANATKYAYQDNVHLFVGSTCSSVSLPIVDVIHKAGVPMLIPHSTNYKITLKGSPWVFRVPISSRFSAAAAAKYTAENIGTKIAYIWASDAASQADAQKFYEYIRNFHGEGRSTRSSSRGRARPSTPPPQDQGAPTRGADDLRPVPGLRARAGAVLRGRIPPSVKRIGGSAASNRPAPILAGDAIKGCSSTPAFSYVDPDPNAQAFREDDHRALRRPDSRSRLLASLGSRAGREDGAGAGESDPQRRFARRRPGRDPGRARDHSGLQDPRRRRGRLLCRCDAGVP